MRTIFGTTTAVAAAAVTTALALVAAAAPALAAPSVPAARTFVRPPAVALAPALRPLPVRPLVRRPATTVPDAATWTAISRAVTTSPLTAAVPSTAYVVVDVERSVHAASWAAADLEPRAGGVDPARVVLHEVAGTWTLVEVGTWRTGCDVAPRAARRDLALGC